ncbi:MAG: hypothetical protein APR62_03620 [Smithella sp. SDB]|nr:MAG: hypothetical protein APR62_03620 [Smithella sp. SDB]
MRGIECKVAVAVLLLLIFGTILSLVSQDWQYFERSGSLVVLVGIGIAWRDIVSLAGNIEKLYEGDIEKQLTQLKMARPKGIVAGSVYDSQINEIDADRAEFKKVISLLRKRIRTIEAMVLCIGTIVWGYGMPFVNFIKYIFRS